MRGRHLFAATAAMFLFGCDAPADGTGASQDTATGAQTTDAGTAGEPAEDATLAAPDTAVAETPDTGSPVEEAPDASAPAEDAGASDDTGGGHPGETYFDPYNDPNVQCPPGGETGPNIGDVLPNVKLKRCDGTPFYIHELCGAQAFWIFQTAGWCPHCANTAKTLKDIPQDYFDSGAWIIVNVLRDQNDKVANAAYCQGYAKTYKIPEDRILMAVDPTQTTKKFNTTGGVPFHVVMDREMRIRYMWAGGDTSNTALAYFKIIFKEQAKADADAQTD